MDEQPFLDAICADWDDDTARLVYADWLDERGDPRGEFIRLQIERARYPAGDELARQLREREGQLLAEHNWFLPPSWQQIGLQGGWGGWPDRVLPTFERGLMTTVRMAFETFIRCNEQFEATWPTRCGLELRRNGWDYPALAECSALRNIPALHIDPDCGVTQGQDFAALCRSPHLVRLVTLDLPGYRGSGPAFGAAAARAFLSNKTLRQLKRLRIAASVTEAAKRRLRRRFEQCSQTGRYTVFG